MAPGTAEAIKQIDEVLERYTQLEANFRVTGQDDMASWDYLGPPAVLAAEVIWLLRAALERLSPDGDRAAERALTLTRDECYPESASIRNLAGALRALKADYEAGRLKRFGEMVRSDLFSDFLEMAEYLVRDEGLKDPAAVLAGGVLEQHIRKLCDKHGIPTTLTDAKANPVPKKLNLMNQELGKAGAYGMNDQKQVVAWADIRNDAAHAHYGNYTAPQVALMIQGIRDFLARNPA